MAGKIIRFPGKRRGGTVKPPTDRPERFLTEEYHVGRREDHTQKKYVPEAMNLSLVTTSRWAEPEPRPQRKGSGRSRRRSPSTLRLNNSNVKRKSRARGRTK
jgi:hypothetical protein